MSEETNPAVNDALQPKKRAKLKWTDLLILAIIAGVCILLTVTIMSKLTLKQDVANAQIVSDKVITAIEKRDGAAARTLGDADFKAKNTDVALTTLFKAKEIATLKKPVLENKVAFTDKNGRTVFFLYRYDALKVPFYVRVGVHHTGDAWQLVSITGNANKAKLGIQ